ncbi:hypothetical protein GQ568_01205 [Patescibacteria group bacterium]|nr:hypothetical protein [Patescibacteria group bacterium]
MEDKEKEILKKLVEHPKGSLSPCDMINAVAKRDKRSVHNLISTGYIEEVETYKNDRVYNFYRATEKGLLFFDKWYKKIWFSIKGDIRNIIVSAITAVVIYFLMETIFFISSG